MKVRWTTGEKEYDVKWETNAGRAYNAIREEEKDADACWVKQSEEGGDMVVTLSPMYRVMAETSEARSSRRARAKKRCCERRES